MSDKASYYIIKRKALPEVFLKVLQAKKQLEKQKDMTIQEVIDLVGISRSSFYKYKDTIYPFYENTRGRAITLGMKINDEPGLLSGLLNCIADYKANVLTIHQTIPINGVADITITIEVLPTTGDVQNMTNYLSEIKGVHHIKILARE